MKMKLYQEAKSLLVKIGFSLKDGVSGVWYKKYNNHNDYQITVKLKENLTDSIIDWGEKINVERETTSNLSQSETLVVLECVNRLLEKGYKPENFTLEKQWRLAGYLDIWVKDEAGKSYLMIECKTWGKEYVDTQKKTLNNTGKADKQIFSYLMQEPETEYLCLYTSRLNEENQIEYKNSIIKNIDAFQGKNQIEIFDEWDKYFEKKGVFEEEIRPFNVKFTELQKHELEELNAEDGGLIFNQFAEILRRNVVSDKNNAFNKIFNLFLCKIVDEDKKRENHEMDFQWKKKYDKANIQEENAGYKDFLGKLNDLYKEGVLDYLQMKVTDHSKKEVDGLMDMLPSVDKQTKDKIKQIIEDLRFYKSNEFAFKDVHNEETFEENAKIVKEIVELLQGYKIKYSTKQQFLGDFFELLLNTGIKQESGQFFTPTPIASFICKSLPLWKIMQDKNQKEEISFLPYLIDFASGSGHFLTEAMSEINFYVENKINEGWIKGGRRARDEFEAGKRSFKWAKDYIYGIEKDYRLAKTTKISAFLNGDGDATVICGDGIGSFKHEKKYTGLLRSEDDSKDNQKFDVLVANPPYSVDEFKITINKHGAESFELYEGLSDQASEIECFFIERTKQLLKDGGVAGIILPISILSNGKIYLRAREMMLKYFEIKAIVEFGSNTFMATGTNTATVFMRRRANNEWKIIEKLVSEFFENLKDITVNGIANAFSQYVNYSFEDLDLKDYVSLFSDNPNEKAMNNELIKEYKTHFNKLKDSKLIEAIKEAEKEKILYFMLTYDQDFVLVKAPSDNNEEKKFLGYEFSTRRGHEGIKIYKNIEGKNLTKLYNAEPEQLYDDSKVNSYILRVFEGGEVPEPNEELKNVLQVQKLHESLDFDGVKFDKRITTEFSKKKVKIESKWDLVKLEEVCLDILGGGTPSTKNNEYWDGKVNWATLVDTKEKYLYSTKRKISEKGLQKSNAKLLPINTVIFSSRATIGDVSIAKVKTATNQGYKNFVCNPEKIHYEYLYYILKSLSKNIEALASGMAYPEINKNQISNFKIPLPPLSVQEKIVQEMGTIETRGEVIEREIEEKENEINILINHDHESEKINLDQLCNKVTDGSHNPPLALPQGLPMLSSKNILNNSINFHNPRWIDEKGFQKENKRTDVQEGDVLLTIVGAIGRVALVPKNIQKFTLQRSVSVLKPKKEMIKPEFLAYCLRTKDIQKHLNDMAHGVAQKGVYLKEIKSLKIPLPPLFEQETIVKQIEQIETKLEKLNKEFNDLKLKRKEVLKKYL